MAKNIAVDSAAKTSVVIVRPGLTRISVIGGETAITEEIEIRRRKIDLVTGIEITIVATETEISATSTTKSGGMATGTTTTTAATASIETSERSAITASTASSEIETATNGNAAAVTIRHFEAEVDVTLIAEVVVANLVARLHRHGGPDPGPPGGVNNAMTKIVGERMPEKKTATRRSIVE